MTRTTFSFLAVFSLALVTVVVGSPPAGSALVWTGYGVQANILAAAVVVGAHLVLAALITRVWQGLRRGDARHLPVLAYAHSVNAPRMLSHDTEAGSEAPDVALIGLRGLTARAAERGELGTARKLARRGLADSPGTAWLEEFLNQPIAPPSRA